MSKKERYPHLGVEVVIKDIEASAKATKAAVIE